MEPWLKALVGTIVTLIIISIILLLGWAMINKNEMVALPIMATIAICGIYFFFYMKAWDEK